MGFLVVLLAAVILGPNLLSGEGGAEAEGAAGNAASLYLKGGVAEVNTLGQFEKALEMHKEGTGLPVVVDFFSHSCGPCVMIAPAFKRMAKEFRGRAVFLKVDVNRNHAASSRYSVRSMPTFVVFAGGKERTRFSGADERRLRMEADKYARQAKSRGTYVGVEVTPELLRAFYVKHGDEAKAKEAGQIARKYRGKTLRLMSSLRKKYGDVPETKKKGSRKERDSERKRSRKAQAADSLNAYTLEELRAELEKRVEEGEAEAEAPSEDESDPFFRGSLSPEPQKVVIVGGGPAGLAAAIYASRAGLSPVLIAPSFGGQLLGKGVDVENFPGVLGAQATGRGIVQLMRKQALSFNAKMIDDVVVEADLSASPFTLRLNGSGVEGDAAATTVSTHTLIIATGAESRWLGVEGEYEFRGNGVSTCATCDGFLYRGQDVVVVGGGDTAMEDALVLARTSKSVTVVHRRDAFRASHTLAQRVLEHDSIEVKWNTVVTAFEGDGDKLTGVALRNTKDDATSTLPVGAAFVAIGHDPTTSIFEGALERDANGYLRVESPSSRTSKEGVFACGDVADPIYRQAVTSSGSGAVAALDAERYLSERGLGA